MTFDNPTVTRRLLSSELRRLRDRVGLTIEDVAARLEWSDSKVSRLETAQWKRLSATDLRALLAVYGLPRAETDRLLDMARAARQRGWWHDYGDAVPAWFENYLGLEGVAHTLSGYESERIPGLLRTRRYCRELIASSLPTEDDGAIERHVELCAGRQRAVLDRTAPPYLGIVLNEAVLRRLVGGADVMREQLHHLLEAGRRPNITLQVLPFDTGAHSAMSDSFVIIGFDEPTPTDLVYLEHQTSGLYLERRREVDHYARTFDRLRTDALDGRESLELIERIAKEL